MRWAALAVLALTACDPASDPLVLDDAAIAEAKAGVDMTADRAAAFIKEAGELVAKAKASVGANPSAEVLALLGRASERIAQAEAARRAGDPSKAGSLAAEAAEIARKLLAPTSTPSERPKEPTATTAAQATAALAEATELVVKAKAAFPNPSGDILSLLTRASECVGQAKAALEAADYARTVSVANECATAARKVIGAATPPPPAKPEPTTAEKAAGQIREATTALSRARSSSGATPTAEQGVALGKAEELLRQAEAKLAAGDAAAALELAIQSQKYSRPLIK